jgi:hypothetical protein
MYEVGSVQELRIVNNRKENETVALKMLYMKRMNVKNARLHCLVNSNLCLPLA